MSETESFINEVTEEVRRDRLFMLLRRYGWIAIVLVILLVGGAAYNEWRKASEQARAQAEGDAILTALDDPNAAARIDALNGLAPDGEATTLVNLLVADEAVKAEKRPLAIKKLRQMAQDQTLAPVYRDLAALKLDLLEGDARPAEERRAALTKLTEPGAPYRLLAQEQLALIDISQGDRAAAIDRLKAILADVEVTPGLRRRASQLIVAEGGNPEGKK